MRSMRFLSLILVIAILAIPCMGCSTNTPSEDGVFKITTTVFAEYDWVSNILGERIKDDDCELNMLLDKGVDSHSFEPTTHDIVEITSSDIFVYVGGESDAWVDDLVHESGNSDLVCINLMSLLDDDYLKQEEVIEGMQSSEEESDEIVFDEHIWLSIDNAISSVNILTEAICEADPNYSDLYRENAASYISKLEALKNEAMVLKEYSGTIVVADRFPFRYLCDEFGINYYAAFSGCEAETEATFETITFLIDKVNETKVDYIYIIDGSDDALARTIISGCTYDDIEVLMLDSMQSVTSEDIQNGANYIGIMRENINTLAMDLEANDVTP